MKKGWEYKELGEVAVFSQGIQVDVNLQTENCSPGKVRFLRIIDVTQGNVPPRYIDDPGEKYYLKADEIAMVRYGTIGFVCYGIEGVIANNLFKISIKDKSKLQSNYLQYFFYSYLFQSHIRKSVGGAALPSIKFGDIKHIMLGIPPLSEQKEIVKYLDSSFAKIDILKANAAKNLDEAKALFQSTLKEALEPKKGWEEKALKELTRRISDGSHNPPTGLSYSEYRMLSSKNVRNDKFSFDNPRYLSQHDFQKEHKRTQLERGDVLLTIVGAGLGDCCVYDYDDVIVFQRSVSVLKPHFERITSRFLMYSLQFRYDDIRNQSNGAAQKGIYLKQLAAYKLHLPSLQEQQEIVSRLDSLNEKVNTLQQNYSRICSECDALKQAILRLVFE